MKSQLSHLTRILYFLCLCSFVSCSFERGDRYWSGRPQPIGIDFASNFVIAVYAHGAQNFTRLAAVGQLPGNEYASYMYSKYMAQKVWGRDDHMIHGYDDEESRSPTGSWMELLPKSSISMNAVRQRFNFWACHNSWGFFKRFTQRLCTYYDDTFPSPERPKSRYQHLLTQIRINRFRHILPKWFRTSPRIGISKSNLILNIFEYLERIKELSVKDHGIQITSAIISRPSWADEYADIFDEACLLAGIEVLESPSSRVNAATKSLTFDNGPVLVLDHGYYQLGIHRSTWDERNGQYAQRSSMSLDEFGTESTLRQLAGRIIAGYVSNVTEASQVWANHVYDRVVMEQVMIAKTQIKYRGDWPQDLEFDRRTIGMNLTDITGFLRVLNVTGKDVRELEQEYLEGVSRAIRSSICRYSELDAYAQSRNFSIDKYSDWIELADSVAAPPEIGSWFEEIKAFILLDSGIEASLLHEGAQLALGENASQPDSDGKCVPTIENAARGAALRAREWVEYWRAYEKERFSWEHFDVDDPETWYENDEYEEAIDNEDRIGWEEHQIEKSHLETFDRKHLESQVTEGKDHPEAVANDDIHQL